MFLLLSVKGCLYILNESFNRYVSPKYFLAVCGLSSHALNRVFCTAKGFNPAYQFFH